MRPIAFSLDTEIKSVDAPGKFYVAKLSYFSDSFDLQRGVIVGSLYKVVQFIKQVHFLIGSIVDDN